PRLAAEERARSAARSRAFAASTSRSRGGAVVTRASSNSCAACATCSTARLNAAWFALDGRVNPLSLRTNCRADPRTSSPVAGGSKLCSSLMFRHMGHPQLFNCMEIGFVTRCHSLGERPAIENSVHHARKTNRVGVMEESNEEPSLSVGQSERRVGYLRRMLKFDAGEIEQRACTFNGNMIAAPNGVARSEFAYAF